MDMNRRGFFGSIAAAVAFLLGVKKPVSPSTKDIPFGIDYWCVNPIHGLKWGEMKVYAIRKDWLSAAMEKDQVSGGQAAKPV